MLDEKDRMLGAIGHDLRTPLASLRIRAESMEPEEERGEMIATIEEMAGDARRHAHAGAHRPGRRAGAAGRPRTRSPTRVVEEFRDAGPRRVALEPGERPSPRSSPICSAGRCAT